MSRKIIKIGSSEGVTIPDSVQKKMGLSKGDEVNIVFNEDTGRAELEPVKKESKDKDIKKWTEEFVEEYRGALEELADK